MQESYWEEKGIYYRTNTFEPGRPTLVFIHGLTGSSSAWWPYEKILENKYNIVSYDMRGHGKSKKFKNYADYTIKNFADDLEDLVTYLHIPKFVIITHSFATSVALEYIKSFGKNVAINILISPIAGTEKSLTGKILRLLLRLTKIFSFFPFNPKPGKHTDYSKFNNTTDWDIKRMYTDIKDTTLHIHLYCLRQSMLLGQEYFLERITVPTLIINGTKDTMAPMKNSIALSKKIKNAQIALTSNADHMVVLNNIKELSDIIESFIGKKNLLY